MMNKFYEIASSKMALSPICNGRSQLSTIEVIDRELTIVKFDFATIVDKGEEKIFPVILFDEFDDRYYNGGALLKNICQAWVDAYGGDITTCNEDLAASGGVRIKLKASKTKDGKNLTTVELL